VFFPESCFNADGRLRIKAAVPVNPSFVAGIACGPDFLFADFNSPQVFPNGTPALRDGRISMQNLGTVHIEHGLPITDLGAVSSVAALPDHFQNGLPFNGDRIAVEVVP